MQIEKTSLLFVVTTDILTIVTICMIYALIWLRLEVMVLPST